MRYSNDYAGQAELVRDQINSAVFYFEDGAEIKVDNVFFMDTKNNSDKTLMELKFPFSPTCFFSMGFVMGKHINKIVMQTTEYDVQNVDPIIIENIYEGDFVVEFIHGYFCNEVEHYDQGLDIVLIEDLKGENK